MRYIQFQGTNLMLSALMANELGSSSQPPHVLAPPRGASVTDGSKTVAATARSSGYAIVARPDIDSIKALIRKGIAINSFGSSADFAIYQLFEPKMDWIPTKMLPSRQSQAARTASPRYSVALSKPLL